MNQPEPTPTVITEYGITDGTDGTPEHLGSATREDAEGVLAAQRRLWDELPINLVQRTVTTTPWTPVDAEPTSVLADDVQPPAVGDAYTHRETGQHVTVTSVWADDEGRTAVAFEWRDDKPGQCGSACPLGVFLGTYKPVVATEPTVTVTVAQVEAALRGYLAMLDYDLHKSLECGEETGEDTYAEEADDLFDRLRDAAGSEQEEPANADMFSASELHDMDRADEYAMDAADDAAAGGDQ